MSRIQILFLAVTASFSCCVSAVAPTTTFKLGFIEVREDNPAGESYREASRAALFYAIGENEKRLSKCGYSIETTFQIANSEDKLGAKEAAQKLENAGVWFIFGPGRSYDFLMAKQGLRNTGMISVSASAKVISNLPPPFFSMYPSAEEMAKVMTRALHRMAFGTRYGVVSDAGCPPCRDYAEALEAHSAGFLEKLFSIDVVGTRPDLFPLKTQLTSHRVDFLLVPNYSDLSGYIMGSLHSQFPKIKFVGYNSWGDELVGAFEEIALPPTVQGLHVRAGTPPSKMQNLYKVFSLHRQWKGAAVLPQASVYLVVDFIRILTSSLCQSKPLSKDAFVRTLSDKPRDFFRPRSGVSIYTLEGGSSKPVYGVVE